MERRNIHAKLFDGLAEKVFDFLHRRGLDALSTGRPKEGVLTFAQTGLCLVAVEDENLPESADDVYKTRKIVLAPTDKVLHYTWGLDDLVCDGNSGGYSFKFSEIGFRFGICTAHFQRDGIFGQDFHHETYELRFAPVTSS